MSLLEDIEDARIKAAEEIICKNLDKLELATDAVQRGGSLIRDRLLRENDELKSRIKLLENQLIVLGVNYANLHKKLESV